MNIFYEYFEKFLRICSAFLSSVSCLALLKRTVQRIIFVVGYVMHKLYINKTYHKLFNIAVAHAHIAP